MKILLVADEEIREIWDHWDSAGKKRLEGVDLILSAGDLKPDYLEFLVTMLNVPCLYVRGNHDSWYSERPPEGCLDIDGRICEVRVDEGLSTSAVAGNAVQAGDCCGRVIRIAGLGGSMRYREGTDMYTEREMASRARRLRAEARVGAAVREDGRRIISRSLALSFRDPASRPVDILLTHAPCKGYGDMDDLPHTGFECFGRLLETIRPAYHCYGHVHMEYGNFDRTIQHPSGAQLINVSGMYILDI